ncbi:MAG: hypothetical protein WA705_19075 [Candidatus Ozemobacteraceae bacterium]
MQPHPLAKNPRNTNLHIIGGIILLVALALTIRWARSARTEVSGYAPAVSGVTAATGSYAPSLVSAPPTSLPPLSAISSPLPAVSSPFPSVNAPSAGNSPSFQGQQSPNVQPSVTPQAAPSGIPIISVPAFPVPPLPTQMKPPAPVISAATASALPPFWKATIPLPPVNALLATPDGQVWAATEWGLALRNAENANWTLLRQSEGRFPAPHATALAHDGKSLWVGSSMGLFRTEDGHSFRSYGKSDGLISDMIWSLTWDGQILWVGTQAGVSFLTPDGRFQSIDKKITNGGLADIWIGSLFRRDSFLFCGNDDGLSIWDTRSPAADPKAWVTIDMFATNLSHNWILGLTLFEQALWTATPLGLCRLETPIEDVFRSGGTARWTTFNRSQGLPADRINALVALKGALWVGTSEGLCRYSSGAFRSLRLADGLMASDVRALAVASDTLWVGTSAGAQALDPALVQF